MSDSANPVLSLVPFTLLVLTYLLWKLPAIKRKFWGSVAAEISTPNTIEIDITRQSRALGILRAVEHWMAIQLGLSAAILIIQIPLYRGAAEFLTLPIASFFGWAAYMFFRQSGAINQEAWNRYLILFPVLFFVSIGVLAFVWTIATIQVYDKEFLAMASWLFWLATFALLGLGCVLSLLRAPISQLSIPTSQLLAKLNARVLSEPPPLSSVKKIDPIRGTFFSTCAVLLLGGSLVLFARSDHLLSAFSGWLLFPGYICAQRARRYFHFSVDSLLTIDKRRPVLFLRSFSDDELQTSQNPQNALLDYSLELRLAKHFSSFGPFIAIGSPSDTVPQLGAARAKLSDNQWQQAVIDWIKSASVVVMYLGKTTWVTWELEQLIKNEQLQNLIVVMPEIRGWSAERRCEELAQRSVRLRLVFRDTLWADQLTSIWDYTSLRALVFRADGSIVLIKSGARSRDSYHFATLIAHFILSESADEATKQ